MNNNVNVGLFLAMLIVVTFFAPLFIDRGARAASKSKAELKREALQNIANRAFALYALGGTLYVVGLAAMLPAALLGFDAPNIIRLDGSYFVVYNTIVLDSRGFLIYMIFFFPLFMLSAAVGIWRFEKSQRVIEIAEQIMRDESGRA